MEESVSGSNEKGAEEMTPQTEFLNILCDTVEKECDLSHKISLRELSEKNGLYAELGEGFSDTQYYDKSSVRTMPVLFYAVIPTKNEEWKNFVKSVIIYRN